LPRICKLNNKYREIYTRKSSAFRLHAAQARRGLVAPVARGRRYPFAVSLSSAPRRAALRCAGPTLYTHTRARPGCTCTTRILRGEGVRLYGTLHWPVCARVSLLSPSFLPFISSLHALSLFLFLFLQQERRELRELLRLSPLSSLLSSFL